MVQIALLGFYFSILDRAKFLLWETRRANRDPTHAEARIESIRADLRRIWHFSPDDLLKLPGLAYFGSCVFVGLLTGYVLARAYSDDWVLEFFSEHLHWQKRTDRNLLENFFWTACSRSNSCIKDPPKPISPENTSRQYMRIWWKSGGFIFAGCLQDFPTGRGKYIVGLSGSCQLVANTTLKTVAIVTQTQPSRNENGITAFVDLGSPNILFTEILTDTNPCVPATYVIGRP